MAPCKAAGMPRGASKSQVTQGEIHADSWAICFFLDGTPFVSQGTTLATLLRRSGGGGIAQHFPDRPGYRAPLLLGMSHACLSGAEDLHAVKLPSPHPATLPDVARDLANTLISLKNLGVTDRWIISDILKATLEKHPEFWGVWTIWEPDALDGRDHEFANQRGHDASGRYAPLWKRTRGGLQLEPNVGYSQPGVGDYYLIPIQKQREVTFAPYEYRPADGVTRRIISQVAPIFDQGRCVGVAGFDMLAENAGDPGTLETERFTNASGSGNSQHDLSKREQEVLSWVSRGKSNAEIGIILGISAHTVKHHMEKIFSKLGVENRHAAMLCALRPFIQKEATAALPNR